MDSRQGSHEGSHVAGPGESQAKLAWARTGLREPGAAQVAQKSRSSGRGSWDGEDRGVRGYSLVAGGRRKRLRPSRKLRLLRPGVRSLHSPAVGAGGTRSTGKTRPPSLPFPGITWLGAPSQICTGAGRSRR